MTSRFNFFLASLLFTQACAPVRTVPPPAVPDQSLPPVAGPLPEPGGGMARVVVSTDVPARVERITAMTEQLERHIGTRDVPSIALLCEATPCAVTLPYGDYELVFTGIVDRGRTSSATLHVRTETVVMKHTLGQVRHASGQTSGYALVITGIILLGVAGGLATTQTTPRASSSTVGGFALAGLGGLALGGVVLAASPTTRQEGSTSQFTPAPAPPALGMSIGGKF